MLYSNGQREDFSSRYLCYKKKKALIDATLYNRDELQDELQNPNSEKLSDEEFLLDWIGTKGLDALARVNGDFAGVILEGDTLTLFRDHMGIRPLYYYVDDERAVFDSDLRGITSIPEVNSAMDEEQLFLFMAGRNYLSSEDTNFKYIKCVKPASYLTITRTKEGFDKKEHIYWQPGMKKVRKRSNQAYIAGLRELIEDAVRRRIAVVPGKLGGELSGGLDSGVIDILISRMGREIQFGSWSFPVNELPLVEGDERKIIEDICKQENKECFYIGADEKAYENPFEEQLPPFVNTVNISITARKMNELGVNVVFTGHGGDEGVSHRTDVVELFAHGEFAHCFSELYYATRGQSLRLLRTIKHFSRLPSLLSKRKKPLFYAGNDLSDYLNREYVERMNRDCNFKPFAFGLDVVEQIKAGGLRPRLDNLAFQGAQYGVQYMVPYLDYRVIDYAVSIPRHMYVKHGMDRYIFRKAFEDIMPESLKKVNYKDTPSLRNYVPKDQRSESETLQEELKKVLSYLDENRWEQYFNFAKIREVFIENAAIPEELRHLGWRLAASLSKCIFIQKMQDERLS